MLDRHRVRDARVRAAQVLGQRLQTLREPAHVRLVDHGVAPRDARAGSERPGRLGDHDGVRHERQRVARVGRAVRVVADLAADRRVVHEFAGEAPGVRVDEQLRGVVPQAGGRVPRPVDAEAVPLAGTDARDVAVPHAVGGAGERDPALAVARRVVRGERRVHHVHEAQLDGGRVRREHGDVDAVAGEADPERWDEGVPVDAPGAVGGTGLGRARARAPVHCGGCHRLLRSPAGRLRRSGPGTSPADRPAHRESSRCGSSSP